MIARISSRLALASWSTATSIQKLAPRQSCLRGDRGHSLQPALCVHKPHQPFGETSPSTSLHVRGATKE